MPTSDELSSEKPPASPKQDDPGARPPARQRQLVPRTTHSTCQNVSRLSVAGPVHRTCVSQGDGTWKWGGRGRPGAQWGGRARPGAEAVLLKIMEER